MNTKKSVSTVVQFGMELINIPVRLTGIVDMVRYIQAHKDYVLDKEDIKTLKNVTGKLAMNHASAITGKEFGIMEELVIKLQSIEYVDIDYATFKEHYKVLNEDDTHAPERADEASSENSSTIYSDIHNINDSVASDIQGSGASSTKPVVSSELVYGMTPQQLVIAEQLGFRTEYLSTEVAINTIINNILNDGANSQNLGNLYVTTKNAAIRQIVTTNVILTPEFIGNLIEGEPTTIKLDGYALKIGIAEQPTHEQD